MLLHPTSSSSRPHGGRATARRAAAVALVGGSLLLSTASVASAHVRVHPDSTESGGYAQLTFRVPDESPTAGTVKLAVTLPQDTPFTSVSTTPVAGWTVAVTKAPLPSPVNIGGATITEAPRTVTWTANPGVQVRPGEYQDFPISVGPLPAPGEVVLPATQTYSDGTVVRWSQTSTSAQAEPDHPAPSFTVTTPSGPGADDPAAPASAISTQAATGSSGPTTRWLTGAALILSIGAVGLVLVRSPRRQQSATPGTEPRATATTGTHPNR